jgi:hypothetical protein
MESGGVVRVEVLAELFCSELKLSFLLRRKPLKITTKITGLESAIMEYTMVSAKVYSL